MDTTVPYSVGISTENGAVAALRQLSTQTTTASRDAAKALIVGYFERQTESGVQKSSMAAAKLKKDDLTHDMRFRQLEEAALLGFGYEFIEARRELNLPRSTVFPRPEIAIPAFIDTQAEVWDALNAAVEPKDYLLVLSAYANGKEKKGKSSAEVSAKLDHLERKLMEHRVYRFSDAFIQFRSDRSLPPSQILHTSKVDAGFALVTGALSSSSDPAVSAQAAYRFLSRRAVDGYVESSQAVISALEEERRQKEDGRALLLLQGFCDYNRRNGYPVEDKLNRLEKELLGKKLVKFSTEIQQTRLSFSLPPSHLFPSRSTPSSSAPSSPPRPSASNPTLDSQPSVFRESSEDDGSSLPAYATLDFRRSS